MTVHKGIEEINNFKYIHEIVKAVDINERSKKIILDRIDWEFHYTKRKLINSLGENEYDKLCAIEERNKK